MPRTALRTKSQVREPIKYRVNFTRLGRNHNPQPLECAAADADELAEQVFKHAKKSLASSWFEVVVDLETMKGSIEYGRFGEFTVEVRK